MDAMRQQDQESHSRSGVTSSRLKPLLLALVFLVPLGVALLWLASLPEDCCRSDNPWLVGAALTFGSAVLWVLTSFDAWRSWRRAGQPITRATALKKGAARTAVYLALVLLVTLVGSIGNLKD